MCLQSIGGMARTMSEMVRKTWASLDVDLALQVVIWAVYEADKDPESSR